MEQRVATVTAVDPLMTPLILSNIFNRLTLKTQKEFRQVNSIWAEASVSQWRKCALIKIEMPAGEMKKRRPNVICILNETTVLKKGGAEEFIKLWKGSSPEHDGDAHPNPIRKQPFRRFNLCWPDRWYDCQDDLVTNSSLREFWELCSPQMEYLQLSHFNRRDDCFFPTMKWILLEGERSVLKELNLKTCSLYGFKESCENEHVLWKRNSEPVGPPGMEAPLQRTTAEALTNLSISCYSYTYQGNGIKNTHYQDLFEIIPNLKALSTDHHCSSHVIRKGLAASTEIMTNIKLETLDLDMRNDADIFNVLLKYVKDSKTELKNVTLNFYWDETDPIFIYALPRFLDSCSTTLSKLELTYFDPFPENSPYWVTSFNGLLFPKLTELHLWVSKSRRSDDDEFMFDFRGLCGMPALKLFAINKDMTYIRRDKFKRREISKEELSYDDGGITESTGDKKFNQDLSSLHLDHLEEFRFHMYRRLGVDSLRKLASWMKNLKKAELALNDKTFPVIKEVWPNLEQLTLRIKGKVKDEIIQRERIVNDNGPIRIWIEKGDFFNEYYTSDDDSLFSASSDEEEASSLK